MDWYNQMLGVFSDHWTAKLGRAVEVISVSEHGYGSGFSGHDIETTFYFDDRSVKDYEGSLSEFIEELNE